MTAKITVTQIADTEDGIRRDFQALIDHTREHDSELVLLPEMPAQPWIFEHPAFSKDLWQETLAAHDKMIEALPQFGDAVMLGTHPIQTESARYNQAFAWSRDLGYRAVHHKCYFPDEPGFYEARWFDRPERRFRIFHWQQLHLGFLICTELMFNEYARWYGRHGANVIAVPRATEHATLERWLVALRMAAIVSGAFVISANHAGIGRSGVHFGGGGAIISPEGEVLAVTTNDHPFVTITIDLAEANSAKSKYPRYVKE